MSNVRTAEASKLGLQIVRRNWIGNSVSRDTLGIHRDADPRLIHRHRLHLLLNNHAPENTAITRIESPSKQPQSWVKFTAPSPVLEKSSLRHQRYVSPHPILYVRCCLPMRRSMITAPQNLRRMATNIRCLQVEPQEKKKTPKGRAKKRITYTRRFVNVTMTGGKRKVRYGFEI